MTTIDLSTLDGSNGFVLDGKFAPGLSGFSVSNAGDINGDGYDDIIIGSPTLYSVPEDPPIPGSSYIIFGKVSVFDAKLDLSSLDGSQGFRIDGEAGGDEFGRSVSGAGDVNGDGFDDVIVGASAADFYSGASYVVFGKNSGFDAVLNLSSLDGNTGFRLEKTSNSLVSNAGDFNGDGFDDVLVNTISGSNVIFGKASGFDATIDLSNLDSNSGFSITVGTEIYSAFSVSSAGDINGDGFDDVIVGSPFTDPKSSDGFGSCYVVFGKNSGFANVLDLSSLDGSQGFLVHGRAADSQLGISVSGAGDVNGDGFDDVIIGSPFASRNGDFSGSSYVMFGKATGFSAALDLASLNGSNGFRLDGVSKYDEAGASVSSAGDVNGDGFDDMIVGAWRAAPNGLHDAGSSYVVFGKAAGLDATIDLSNLDSNSGFRLVGAAGDSSGFSVSSAGDVNDDGFDDLIVGAHYGEASYVIFGRTNFTADVIEGTSGDDTLKGTTVADTFEAGDGNDTLLGLGDADIFHAGAGNDDIKISDLNFAQVEGGGGEDVLHLTGSNLNMNLANEGDKISGIETICLYGTGDNTLTLTAVDVLNLSDATNTLEVNGNAGDLIVGLSNSWIDGGISPNGYFHTYTQEDAVLLVGINVTTDFV